MPFLACPAEARGAEHSRLLGLYWGCTKTDKEDDRDVTAAPPTESGHA